MVRHRRRFQPSRGPARGSIRKVGTAPITDQLVPGKPRQRGASVFRRSPTPPLFAFRNAHQCSSPAEGSARKPSPVAVQSVGLPGSDDDPGDLHGQHQPEASPRKRPTSPSSPQGVNVGAPISQKRAHFSARTEYQYSRRASLHLRVQAWTHPSEPRGGVSACRST